MIKIIFFILIFPTFVFAETYSCKYKELNQIKYINFDRITHSHFTRCIQDECNKQKYSVIFANNEFIAVSKDKTIISEDGVNWDYVGCNCGGRSIIFRPR